MSTPLHPSLLDQLPLADQERLLPHLHLVTLAHDQVLYQAGHVVPSVYFPVTAWIEEVLPMSDGAPHVVRRIGAQAMAGSCVLGDSVTSHTARVCAQGKAYRLSYGDFVKALETVSSFRELVLRDAAHALRL